MQLSELWGRQPGDRYLSFYETSELLKKYVETEVSLEVG